MQVPKKYIAVWQETGGQAGSSGRAHGSVREAADAIEEHMVKRGVEPQEAARFTYRLSGCRVGAICPAPSGEVSYRILEADFTSDRKAIVPGLRVTDHDRQPGTVTADQFMQDIYGYPGGEYFDNWYYVTRDGEDRAYRRFNGERMESLYEKKETGRC